MLYLRPGTELGQLMGSKSNLSMVRKTGTPSTLVVLHWKFDALCEVSLHVSHCHENSQQKLIEYLKGRVLVVSGPRHRRERQAVGEGFLGGYLGVERSVGPVSNLDSGLISTG